MNRADFEARLIEDEALRASLEDLREIGRHVNETEEQLTRLRNRMHQVILLLALKHDVPLALLARSVGLSPQRINSILKEQQAKLRKAGEREPGPVGWAADQVRQSREPKSSSPENVSSSKRAKKADR